MSEYNKCDHCIWNNEKWREEHHDKIRKSGEIWGKYLQCATVNDLIRDKLTSVLFEKAFELSCKSKSAEELYKLFEKAIGELDDAVWAERGEYLSSFNRVWDTDTKVL